MTGGIEVAGDIATGALVGRAVESHAGEGRAGGAHGHGRGHGLCLNCGTALGGDFCHACGQAGHVHRTLASIGHDLLHGVFHFEGKVWRTLPMLVTRPGALTRRYIAGERARFVSPLALFLFSVFLMFAVIHSTAGDFDIEPPAATDRAAAIAQLDTKIAKAQTRLTRAQAVSDADDVTAARSKLQSLQSVRAALASGSIAPDAALHKASPRFSTTLPALEKGIEKANANPGLMLYKLQSSAYKYSWALIPLSLPLVALLFAWRRQFKLYDHAIFVTYSLSFMMFLVVVLSLCLAWGAPGWITGLLLLVPPVHMFAQLRGAYSLRKRSALWRTAVLLVFAWVALIAFAGLLLVMGLME